MTPFTIYLGNKNYSSWSLRGWLALKQTGAAFDEKVIPLYEPGYRKEILSVSPSGKVPALRHGDLIIWDSLAIGEYLAEKFPAANLWPRDADERARARSVSAEMHSGFAPLRAHLPMNIRGRFPGRDIPAKVADDIDRIVAIWRDCRERYGRNGDFLFGNFGLADVMFAPIATRFQTFAVSLDDVAQKYCDAVLAHPNVQEWTRDAEKEPWVVDYAEF